MRKLWGLNKKKRRIYFWWKFVIEEGEQKTSSRFGVPYVMCSKKNSDNSAMYKAIQFW